MPRYLALLRGVSPLNAKMPELRRSFERAGFTKVRTVLSSGNVAFDTEAAALAELERLAEEAMQAELGRSFRTIVRTAAHLQELLAADPFAGFELPPQAKRVVTFLGSAAPPGEPLPIVCAEVRILRQVGAEVFTAYVPQAQGPMFMRLLESRFGRDITTRTWESVHKCARA